MIPNPLPTADHLEDLPTLNEGYTCDLKIDTGDGVRIWLHRTSIEDGEPYRRPITIECRDPRGYWQDAFIYDGDHYDPLDELTFQDLNVTLIDCYQEDE